MNNSKKMKVGMVGVGGFGGARRTYMRQSGLFDLVAAYDLNLKALEDCRKQDGAQPVASYGELLDYPGLEAVIISTGAKFHAAQVIAAAKRGLHVFVEKPLCSTPQEVRDLFAIRKKTGVVIGVGHCDHSADATSLTLKRMLDRGHLGKVAAFEATTCHSGGLMIKPGEWRGDPKKNPGGMLFQCGVHALHELMFLFGPIRRISSMMRYDIHTTKTAQVALCLIEMQSGVVGTLNAYHVSPYRHTLNLFGSKRNLYYDARFFDEGSTLLCQTDHYDGKKQPKVPVKIQGRSDPCGNLRSFYRAVRQGGSPYPDLVDGARAVTAVFAAEESARTGQAVNVPKF